jgi:L-alanine-DL-glutamate epimerase-like enolase superfamily enzyme
MKIQDARVIVSCPGRNFVTLKLMTEEGLHGIGDATLNGREMAVVAYLNEHVLPCLIGRDAHRIEDTWQYLYRGAYWRRGPVTMSAIAAVDTALWDLKAKAAGLPLYQLLGGRSRSGVLVYGHANGRDIAETADEVQRYLDLGYLAIRAQCGVPGLGTTYGVSGDKMYYEPADAEPADRERLVDREIPGAHTAAVRGAARALWRGTPPAARRAPPAHADRRRRGSASRWNRTRSSGWRTRRPRRTRPTFA